MNVVCWKKLGIIAAFCIFLWSGQEVQASDIDYSILDEQEFTEIDQTLDQVLGGENIEFRQLVKDIVTGKEQADSNFWKEKLSQSLFHDWNVNKKAIVHVFIIAVAAAILSNFTSVFENSQIADISFYIVYLLLVAVMLKSFTVISGEAQEVIQTLLEFMKAAVPAYLLTLAFSTGGTTAAVFYELIVFLMYLVSWLLSNILIPMVNLYVLLVLINNVSKEDILSKLAELLNGAVEWLLKFVMTVIIGLNIIQGLIAPAVDGFKKMLVTKTGGMLPGVGNAVNSVSEMVIGTGILIKNGVGAAVLILLLLMCAVPLVKLGVFTVMYKLSAAAVQPISDKRMVACIGCIGDGARLLFKVVFTAFLLFMITIAIITVSTTIR